MRVHSIIALCLALLFLAPLALADEIVKKDGSSVKGVIVNQSSKIVRIMDARGRTHRISMKDVDSVLEGAETGNDAVDLKLEEIDTDDADELVGVAKWAREKKNRAWKLVAMLALRADETNGDAHELLGHQKVGDTWYTNKKKAETARKKLLAEKWKSEGYLKWKGGWIKKEDKALASKDPKAFTLTDEGVWRDVVSVKKEAGYILVKGKWVKGGTPADNADMKGFKKNLGEDIWIITTPHFRLWVQQIPPDEVEELGALCEKTYQWFLKEMAIPDGTDLFRGNKAKMFVLKDKNTAMDWYKHYKNRFGLDDQFQKLLERGGGNILASGAPLASHIPTQDGNHLRQQLVNHSAHCCLHWFSRGLDGRPEPWLREGFGVHAEHEILGNGLVVHSTLAKYGGSGGIADKAFSTKDAKDRAKGTVRNGEDEAMVTLNKLDLNSLNGDHYSKAYTLIAWLMKHHLEEFRKFIRGRRRAETLAAFTKAFGWSPEEIDSKWRDLVKKEF